MRDFIKDNKELFIIGLLISFVCSFVGFSYITYDLYKQVSQQREEQKAREVEYKKQIELIIDNQEAMTKILGDSVNKIIEIEEKTTYRGKYDKEDIKNLQFTTNTDLKEEAPTITKEDMDKIISVWAERNGQTGFLGRGQEFIDAAKASGLNPIYLFAHAAVESGWGTSYLATSRGNYFGIAAYDSDPDAAYHMDGITEGGMWIDENFYRGRDARTLAAMKANNYASSSTWEEQIASIVNQSYNILASL